MNWELILKHVNQETDAQECRQVESWLDEQPENKYLLVYLQKRRAQLQQPLKQADIDKQWLLLLNRIFENPAAGNFAKSRNLFGFIGIAASLVLVSLLGWLYIKSAHQYNHVQTMVLQTPPNKRGTVTLPDGTQVFMAPATKITYTAEFGTQKRELQLTGEAFFNVKHQAQKPFIIHTATQVSITVLGTSFNVYAHKSEATEVKVATGLVGVSARKRTCFLRAGQQLNCLPNNKVMAIKPVEPHDALALQTDILFFKNNTPDEIAAKLQRWYNISVSVLPSARTHPRFSGEMKDDGIHNVLRGLNYATGIRYRYQNSHTLLLF